MIKSLLKTLVLLLALLVVAFFALRVADTDPQAMIEQYGGADIQSVSDGLGGSIFYTDTGESNKPTLLLIHGSNSSHNTWQFVTPYLVEHFRVIAYSQHGHGITGPHPSNDYSASAKIDAAVRVLDAAAVDKAIWVGNSMGGWVAWRAALAVPERVSALVLIDALGVQGGEQITPYFAARLSTTKLGEWIMPHITPRWMVAKSLEDNFVDHSLISEQMIDRYWQLLRFPGNRQATVHRNHTDRQAQKWSQAKQISQPTLILWGEQDKVIPFSHAKVFNQTIPNSQLISYPNAGHLPMEEQAQQVAEDMVRWALEALP